MSGQIEPDTGWKECLKSWGFDNGKMTMKKRVMYSHFDEPRRLTKDDMMYYDARVGCPDDGKS